VQAFRAAQSSGASGDVVIGDGLDFEVRDGVSSYEGDLPVVPVGMTWLVIPPVTPV